MLAVGRPPIWRAIQSNRRSKRVEIANYSAEESLSTGSRVTVRALRPEDREDFVAAVGKVSDQSTYRRFFGARRHFTDAEISFYVNVDFVRHVALIAICDEDGKAAIIGGARYVAENPRQAEVALMVIDKYQGLGIGGLLLRHLIIVARANGLQRFIALVLPANAAMLKVFQKSGVPTVMRRDAGVIHLTLQLN